MVIKLIGKIVLNLTIKKQKEYEDDIELFSYNELYDILCNTCKKLNVK